MVAPCKIANFFFIKSNFCRCHWSYKIEKQMGVIDLTLAQFTLFETTTGCTITHYL